VAEWRRPLEGVDLRGWAGRGVLVTGATGVVGSWLVKELLAEGARVLVLVLDLDPQSELVRSGDIGRCSVVNGALEDLTTLERAIGVHEIDTVFHLGAQTLVEVARRSPLGTWEANVRGTYNLLESCRRHPGLVKRIVVASSDKAYGETGELPYTEQSALLAREPYEVSKACGDLIAQSYHHAYGLPVVVARCGNIFGGGDLNWSRLVPGTIRSLLADERPLIRSDGTYARDYVYVKDAAHAYVLLADALDENGIAGSAFNFGAEQPVTVLEVVDAIKRLMGCDEVEPIVENRVVGEIHDQYLSAQKARESLGWSPRYDLEAGLTETIGWYQEFLGHHG
jgi:CDP-glucose 4,6-dehydratase